MVVLEKVSRHPRVVTTKSTSEWKQPIRFTSQALTQSMGHWPDSWPIHFGSVERPQSVTRVSDFRITPGPWFLNKRITPL